MTEPEKAEPKQKFNALYTLLGLVVVWTSFFLVASAQSISSDKIRVILDSRSGLWKQENFIHVLDARAKAMLPFDHAQFQKSSPRHIVKSFLSQAQLFCSDGDLSKISNDSKTITVQAKPLYRLLRRVIDDPKLGFSIQRDQLHFFDQKLEKVAEEGDKERGFAWEATLELSDEPTAIFPNPNSDLCLVISVSVRAINTALLPSRVARIETWDSSRRLVVAHEVLEENTKLVTNLKSDGSLKILIEETTDPAKSPPAQEVPTLYKVNITYEPPGNALRTEAADGKSAG